MASKITIKRSVTAAPPAGLSFGEMALVQGSGLTANQLYVGISGGSPVWVGAQIGTTGTWTDNAAKTSLATQFAIEERIAAKISANTAGVATFNGATGAVTGVASFNGLTGAVGGVTTSVANTFTALQTFSAGISTSGGTFGTPTQLVGTNITGTASGLTAGRVTTNANLTGAITSVGNTTSLGSFTSAELAAALDQKTGSTKVVFDTSPTLISPTLGAALATTINKVTITAPATGSTITITDGKTLAVTNTLTFTGTDASSVAFGAGGTVVYAATNVASFNGATGAVTGVSSFNGLTGAVGGVTTSVANTFTAAQTFSSGISVGGGLTAVNINTTGSISINNTPATLTTTTAGNATVFNTVATSLGIGGAATAITMGAATGTLNLRNPTIIVGNTVATITTASGTGNTLTISPYGSVVIAPTSTGGGVGSLPSLTVTNTASGAGTVSVSGGALVLGTQTDSEENISPNYINFKPGSFGTIFYANSQTQNNVIYLPDASGTVALTTTVVSSAVAGTGISVSGATGAVTITNIGVRTFNGATGAVTGVSSFNGLTGAVGGVTTSVANTFTALQTFSAGISTSGGTFGTPTQLVGTNITGTASGLTAGRVTTNADLTGAITSVGNGTTLGSFTSAHLRNALTDETGTGVAVFGTDPAITASLTTPSTSFDLLNTTATTVNFAGGASSALNIGNVGGTATFAGSVIVNGDFTVQGNTTTLNTTTLNVEDFNITMGLTLNSASLSTGAGIAIGTGTGISFAYEHSSTSWLSTVDLNVLSGKSYKIGGTTVLNSSALGAGITGSSLTQVGTITSGTWQGTAIQSAYVATLNQNTTGSAATVTTAAQPAITSVGTLTSLTVSGTLEAGLIDGGTF